MLTRARRWPPPPPPPPPPPRARVGQLDLECSSAALDALAFVFLSSFLFPPPLFQRLSFFLSL